MKVYIEQRGETLEGTPTFYLVAAEEGKGKHGKDLEEGDDYAGFFHSEDEARQNAEVNGLEIVDEP